MSRLSCELGKGGLRNLSQKDFRKMSSPASGILKAVENFLSTTQRDHFPACCFPSIAVQNIPAVDDCFVCDREF